MSAKDGPPSYPGGGERRRDPLVTACLIPGAILLWLAVLAAAAGIAFGIYLAASYGDDAGERPYQPYTGPCFTCPEG